MLIRTFKLFIILILVSTGFVWLTNNPGTITIVWSDYLIKTNSFGFIFLILVTFIIIFFLINLFQKIRNIPREINISRQKKNIKLADQTLNSLAENLFLGNAKGIEKDSRRIKKFLNNDFFTNFMLFQSAFIQNDINNSKKYLEFLKIDKKYSYIARRVEILILHKSKDTDSLKKLLIKSCKDYPNDDWFHERLSLIYSIEKDWEKAHDTLEKIKPNISVRNKKMLANLKVLSKKNVVEAFNLTNNSIIVILENIKYYIDNNNVKKAAQILNKMWPNFLCFEIMEIFMTYKLTNSKDALQRYKLINRNLKKIINAGGNETKLALAYACYKSSLWGESQNYLDQVDKKSIDKRVIGLYKKLSEKSEKINFDDKSITTCVEPMWRCTTCSFKSKKWEYLCSNCNSIDSYVWPKAKKVSEKKINFYSDFLQNSFRHLPKMER